MKILSLATIIIAFALSGCAHTVYHPGYSAQPVYRVYERYTPSTFGYGPRSGQTFYELRRQPSQQYGWQPSHPYHRHDVRPDRFINQQSTPHAEPIFRHGDQRSTVQEHRHPQHLFHDANRQEHSHRHEE